MAYWARKTEHSGDKRGCGSYIGRRADAKKESNRRRREIDKQEQDGRMLKGKKRAEPYEPG